MFLQTVYKELVFDLREAAAVWNQRNTDTTEGELVSKEAWNMPW